MGDKQPDPQAVIWRNPTRENPVKARLPFRLEGGRGGGSGSGLGESGIRGRGLGDREQSIPEYPLMHEQV